VSGSVVFSKASKVRQTVLGTSLRQNLLFKKWLTAFHFSETTFEDRPLWPPVTVATEQNVATVKCLVEKEPVP